MRWWDLIGNLVDRLMYILDGRMVATVSLVVLRYLVENFDLYNNPATEASSA